MDFAPESLPHSPRGNGKAAGGADGVGAATAPARRSPAILSPWLRAQAINVARHAAALRPFRPGEFGADAAAPTDAHLDAANRLVGSIRQGLLRLSRGVARAAAAAARDPSPARLRRVVTLKERAHDR